MRNYAKKYIANFWFVNRVIWLTVKWNVLVIVLTKKQLGLYISNYYDLNHNEDSDFIKRVMFKQIKRIQEVIMTLPLKKTCLIKTLVKADYLKNSYMGYFSMELFVFKDKNNGFCAHSQLVIY